MIIEYVTEKTFRNGLEAWAWNESPSKAIPTVLIAFWPKSAIGKRFDTMDGFFKFASFNPPTSTRR